jgi:threonine 3-dehydrogenase
MAAMLQSGLNVTPVLTHHFSADEYEQAFEVMRSGRCGKVVLDWTR